MAAERFLASAGIEAVHVPFKSGAEAMSEVMAGRVDFFFGPVGLVLPLVRDGKLSALVVNGAKRSAALPDVPTTGEAGHADADYPFWFGLFAPAKTPREIVEKLDHEAQEALGARISGRTLSRAPHWSSQPASSPSDSEATPFFERRDVEQRLQTLTAFTRFSIRA
jgi:tripartite-type tricarboxylate transporter receptor subunit TctC